MNIDFERFAEDSVQKNSIRLSFFGTCIIWFLLLVLFAFSPLFKKKDSYKTIQIVLEQNVPVPAEKPVPEVEKVSEKKQSSPSAMPAAKAPDTAQSGTVAEKPVPAAAMPKKAAASPAPSSMPKSAAETTAETKSAPAKAKITYKKSVDELLAEQTGSTDKASWDDSIFGSDNAAVSSSNTVESRNPSMTNSKIAGTSALSGTAALADKDSGKSVAMSGSSKSDSGASSSTLSTLSKIASTTYTMSVGGGVSSVASINTAKSGDGKVAVEMSDGSARILLDPSKPVILISEENASLIDSSRNVVIVFKVLAGGNVPFSEIRITPSSLLPLQIQSEIKEQISKWRFSPVASDGQARFEYSIIKR